MLLATILLLCPLPQAGDVATRSVTETPAGVSTDSLDAANNPSDAKSLPSTPEPKVNKDAGVASSSSAAVAPGAASVTPGNPAPVIKPGKLGFTRGYETGKMEACDTFRANGL